VFGAAKVMTCKNCLHKHPCNLKKEGGYVVSANTEVRDTGLWIFHQSEGGRRNASRESMGQKKKKGVLTKTESITGWTAYLNAAIT